MKEIALILRTEWRERFGKSYANDHREIKEIRIPGSDTFFRVIYSQHLEEYQQHPTRKRYEMPDCFMCEGRDEHNIFKEVAKIGHMKIMFSVKYAAPCHYLIYDPSDHRDKTEEKDVIVLHELARETGLSVFGNLKDSGASFPRHIHFQSLETIFPVVESPVQNELRINGVEIAKLRYPISAFRLFPAEENGINVIARAISGLRIPYNPLFYGNYIYLIPRKKSVPSNTKGFKFASAEVAGCIFARSKEVYDLFDRETIAGALDEVCLPWELKDSKMFEDGLLRLLNA